jgi:hypothetical protein
MTVVFKHMTRENAEKLSGGEIRIGSFAYYQDIEHRAAIRDEYEGTTVGQTGEVILTSSEPVETTIAGLKFVTDSGGVIDVSNTKFIRSLSPLYVFSTSLIGDVGHFEGYDTVIRINDIESFGQILVDGRRDLFRRYTSGRVRYKPRVYNALNHPGIDPDPFIKDERFSPDEEFRLVFDPTGTVERYLTFSLDAIKQAFKDRLCELV